MHWPNYSRNDIILLYRILQGCAWFITEVQYKWQDDIQIRERDWLQCTLLLFPLTREAWQQWICLLKFSRRHFSRCSTCVSASDRYLFTNMSHFVLISYVSAACIGDMGCESMHAICIYHFCLRLRVTRNKFVRISIVVQPRPKAALPPLALFSFHFPSASLIVNVYVRVYCIWFWIIIINVI